MKSEKGFTMIELLLVMVVAGIVLSMSITYVTQQATTLRINRTSSQIQQIMNAGLAYYVSNNAWPNLSSTAYVLTGVNPLQPNYLASGTITNPYGQPYYVYANPATPQYMYVYTSVTGSATTGSAIPMATIISGRLPFGYTTATPGTPPPNDGTCKVTGGTKPASCYVVSYINIPAQNLNNAPAVNYASVYHNGACVPVPTCPVDANGNTMTPQIMVVPISVNGTFDTNSDTQYPLSGFTAYASASTPFDNTPPACTTDPSYPAHVQCAASYSGGFTYLPSGKYWRVCMQVITEKGVVKWGTNADNSNWGKNATVLAITRCAITNEPAGSNFTVYFP